MPLKFASKAIPILDYFLEVDKSYVENSLEIGYRIEMARILRGAVSFFLI